MLLLRRTLQRFVINGLTSDQSEQAVSGLTIFVNEILYVIVQKVFVFVHLFL